MVNTTQKKNWIPKTFGGWVVFFFTVIGPSLTIIGSGIKEVGFTVYDLINNSSKEKRLEQEVQNNLWIKNKDCYRNTEPYNFITENKEKLSIIVCPDSGDLYVELQPKDPSLPITHKWIEIPRYNITKPKPMSLINILSSDLGAEVKKHTFLQRQQNYEKGILCREIYDSFVLEVRKHQDESCVLVKKWFSGTLETREVKCTTNCREDL